MTAHCPTCTCAKEPPTYPVACPKCGVTYGPGGEVNNHRPGGEACRLRAAKATKEGSMSERLSDEELEALRKLHEAATPAPWQYEQTWGPNDGRPYVAIDGADGHLANVFHPEDARLVMSMRDALPRLLDALEVKDVDAIDGILCKTNDHESRLRVSESLPPPKERAASAMLAALEACHRNGNIVPELQRTALVATARAAGITPSPSSPPSPAEPPTTKET